MLKGKDCVIMELSSVVPGKMIDLISLGQSSSACIPIFLYMQNHLLSFGWMRKCFIP